LVVLGQLHQSITKEIAMQNSNIASSLREQIKLQQQLNAEKGVSIGRVMRGSVQGESDLGLPDQNLENRVARILGKAEPYKDITKANMEFVNGLQQIPINTEAASMAIQSMTQGQFALLQAQLAMTGAGLQAFSTAFANTFVDSLEGIHDFQSAMQSMADSVVESLKAVAKQLLRVIILQKAAGFLVNSLGFNPAFVMKALGSSGGLFGGFGGGGAVANMQVNNTLDGFKINQGLNFSNLSASQRFGGAGF